MENKSMFKYFQFFKKSRMSIRYHHIEKKRLNVFIVLEKYSDNI